MIRLLTLISLLTFFALGSLVHAAGDVWYGLKLKVEADGVFHPVIHAINVEKVWPSSPAERAGLVVGDAVIAIQGLKVDGAKADELKKAMGRKVGETLRLKIKRDGKEPRDYNLVAAEKPAS